MERCYLYSVCLNKKRGSQVIMTAVMTIFSIENAQSLKNMRKVGKEDEEVFRNLPQVKAPMPTCMCLLWHPQRKQLR